MFREFFNRRNEIWMFLAQWVKFVEQRIDHQGRDHDQSQENQDRGNQKYNTSAAGSAASRQTGSGPERFPNAVLRNSPLVQSQNHEPQP